MPVRSPAPTAVPARRPSRGARPTPVRDAAWAGLDLQGLRELRSRLQDEEGRVSYWRRILQARLDVVRASDGSGGARLGTGAGFDAERLAPVLTDARVGSGRAALVEVLPIDDVPPLPSLESLWARRVEPGDAEGSAALAADLAEAEEQLSDYRSALHARLEEATAELIARYHEAPGLALAALPLPPVRQAG